MLISVSLGVSALPVNIIIGMERYFPLRYSNILDGSVIIYLSLSSQKKREIEEGRVRVTYFHESNLTVCSSMAILQ